MSPAYFDPIVPGLIPAFGAALRAELAWVAAAATIGVMLITALVVLDVARSRLRRRPHGAPANASPALRRAA